MKATILKATRPYEGSTHGLITFQIEVPLYIWTELLTHRRFARNASSARAMGTQRYIDMGYYTPDTFYRQGTGMQASNEPIEHENIARFIWHATMKLTMWSAYLLDRLGVAKEQKNRLIPPTKYIRGIVTGTEDAWKAFLVLRNNPTADRAMQEFAGLVYAEISQLRYSIAGTYINPSGVVLSHGDNHLWVPASGIPHGTFVDRWTYSTEHKPFDGDTKTCIARIARVSYARSTGKNDEALHDALLRDGHMSPFEHIATWKDYPSPNCFTTKREDEYDDGYDTFGWESLRSQIES